MSRVRGPARKLSAKFCGGYQGVATTELEEQGGLMDGEHELGSTSQERLGLGIQKTLFADPFAMSRDSVTLAGGSGNEGGSIRKKMLARA